jgi:hypothetical protein
MTNIQNGMELIMKMDKMFKMDEEYWMPIKNYTSYSVSTYGNVRNNKTGRILKAGDNGDGYYKVILCTNGNRQSMLIHKLVANTFIENLKNKKCVDHIDHNRVNNHISNLRWATNSENSMNKSKHKNNASGYIGVHYRKELNKFRALYSLNGKLKHIGCFNTAEEASKAYQAKIKEHYREYANII